MSLSLLLFIDSIGLQCSCSHSYNSTGTALPPPPFPMLLQLTGVIDIIGPISKDHVHLDQTFNPGSWPAWP